MGLATPDFYKIIQDNLSEVCELVALDRGMPAECMAKVKGCEFVVNGTGVVSAEILHTVNKLLMVITAATE
jgi:hypothetical protein